MTQSSRMTDCFDLLREQGRKALIPFVMAGDPDAEGTLAIMHSLVATGADIIELGMPFSDPMADGPVIQKAGERALTGGMTLRGVLELVAEFRRTDGTTPVVLMGYLNPIEAMGYRNFADNASAAGVDGLLVVDLPAEESAELLAELDVKKLAPIFLLAPTSTEERIKRVAECARGYVYYVSLKGVTGSATLDVGEVEDRLLQIRQFVELPLGVGFGIKNAETAAAVARVADAVVVGSAIVDKIARLGADRQSMLAEVSAFVASMRKAMDAV